MPTDKDDFIDTLSLELRHSFNEADALLDSLHNIDSSSRQEEANTQAEANAQADFDEEDSSVEDRFSTISLHSDDDYNEGEMADDMQRLRSSVECLRRDLDTTVLMVCRLIQKQSSRSQPLIALLDPGSNITMIHKRVLPRGATPKLLRKPREGRTLVGTFRSRRLVWLEHIELPQFNNAPCLKIQDACVFDCKDCLCDIIVGRDFLQALAENHCSDDPHTIEDE